MTDPKDEALIASIQSILLEGDRRRIQQLEQQLDLLTHRTDSADDYLREQVDELLAEVATLRSVLQAEREHSRDLETEVDLLRRKARADAEGVVARMTPVMGDMIGRAIRDSRDEMAESLAPIMGEAIRVQIRNSRQDMVEALYPVIGATVQKAVAEAVRELQRNIDARMRTIVGPGGTLRTALARLRGVSPGELILRDALPFHLREAFLIQPGSGLLLAHAHAAQDAGAASDTGSDSDLIGGMLTAIRDFAHDSFGRGEDPGEELDEVQYGDQRIIIQNGRAAYLAVVITGTEPAGFRAQLRQFVSDLHVRHEPALREYRGDPATLPNLQTTLARMMAQAAGPAQPARRPLGARQRAAIAGLALVGVACLALACFYTRFTVALLPVAFPSPTPTQTFTPSPTATSTLTPSPTRTPSPTSTHTATPSSTPTFTRTPVATPTPTHTRTPTPRPTLTYTPTPVPSPTEAAAVTIGNIWVRAEPKEESPLLYIIESGTPVTVLGVSGRWYLVEWETPDGLMRGWAPAQWIEVRLPIPLLTWTPGPAGTP